VAAPVTTSEQQEMSMAGSRALLRRASQVVPGGVHSGRRKLEPPLCVRRASGAYVEDIDGNSFIDYHAAYGAILLGHSWHER